MRMIDADQAVEEIDDIFSVDDGKGLIPVGITKALVKSMLTLESITPTVCSWISVTDQLPENQGTVLIVKQLKSGQRQIGLGYCIREYKHHDYATGEDRIEPYWVCGGNNNVIYWQALPDLP